MGDYSDDIRDAGKKASLQDRDFHSYTEKNNKITRRVAIEQEAGETVVVESVVSVSDLLMIVNNSVFLKDEEVDCMQFSRMLDGVYLFEMMFNKLSQFWITIDFTDSENFLIKKLTPAYSMLQEDGFNILQENGDVLQIQGLVP